MNRADKEVKFVKVLKMIDKGDWGFSDVVNFKADGELDHVLISRPEAESSVIIVGKGSEELKRI